MEGVFIYRIPIIAPLSKHVDNPVDIDKLRHEV